MAKDYFFHFQIQVVVHSVDLDACQLRVDVSVFRL